MLLKHTPSRPRPRLKGALLAGALVLAGTAGTAVTTTAFGHTTKVTAQPTSLTIASSSTAANSSGLPDGAIKHVWLIILENKSYDATFTGLNKNSYLWRTLPAQGVLLKNYYGTGHFSQDNYESLVSGQAPEQDTQSDCDVAATNFSSNSLIENNGTLSSNPNYGQADSAAGPNAADGKNGCVYPANVPTLFNQLDAAGKTWKGYAQDLGDQPGREDGECGYPGTKSNAPDATVDTGTTTHADSTALNKPANYPGVRSFTGVQAAGNDAAGNPGALEDGYVAKHFPFPWFHSLLDSVTTPVGGGTDCDSSHIANLDSQTEGLYHDLQSESTTPNLSWITPNNCSDAHDAVCKGNNLSGAFNADGSPNYQGVSPAYDPQHTKPTNYAGGLYASDLFLKWYVPLIEQSAAFKDGGLIDVTFDEANPPFANSSFNNANDPSFAPDASNSDPAYTADGGKVLPGVSDSATLKTYLAADDAGENINGQNVSTEPAGPNTPLTYKADGKTPNPGPGDNGFIDRTPASGRTDGASASVGVLTPASGVIGDNSITPTDAGRQVTDGDATSTAIPTGAPCPCYVGPVNDTGPQFPAASVNATGGALTPAASAVAGSFTLVDANGNPVAANGPLTSIALSALTAATDRIYDPTDFTPGGGDTGSVLISPYITPGTSSTVYYNHYSWLRTMEDLFDVSKGTSSAALSPGAGSISLGLDGQGHIGYAAQPGLAPFGPDVFNNPPLPPTKTQSPTLSGSKRVGSTEAVSRGTWTGAVSYSYKWLRDGKAISGADYSSYTLTGADYGHEVTAQVIATNGAGSTSANTGSFEPLVGPKITVYRADHLTGAARVGSRFGLSGIKTTPKTTHVSLQWLRNGSPVSGQTGRTFYIASADKGAKISMRETLYATGWTTTVFTTAAETVS